MSIPINQTLLNIIDSVDFDSFDYNKFTIRIGECEAVMMSFNSKPDSLTKELVIEKISERGTELFGMIVSGTSYNRIEKEITIYLY